MTRIIFNLWQELNSKCIYVCVCAVVLTITIVLDENKVFKSVRSLIRHHLSNLLNNSHPMEMMHVHTMHTGETN